MIVLALDRASITTCGIFERCFKDWIITTGYYSIVIISISHQTRKYKVPTTNVLLGLFVIMLVMLSIFGPVDFLSGIDNMFILGNDGTTLALASHLKVLVFAVGDFIAKLVCYVSSGFCLQ